MASLKEYVDDGFILNLLQRGYSYKQISDYYQGLYPDVRGLSARTFRRYCKLNNLTRLSDDDVTGIVRHLVNNYGHSYGRRMMQGSIRSLLGITAGAVSQRRVSRALQLVAPVAQQARAQDTLERQNPVPYFAPYFGYKGHFDQNEKIAQDYGCTHVLMIDGCSRLVTGYASMPVKNPILIYEFVFRPALCKYGIWDQIRMDHGREFNLVIFVQQLLSVYRNDRSRESYKKTRSTKNYVAERFWPEVNMRINYPLKRAMNHIVENRDLDISDEILKFCFSWVMLYSSGDAVSHLLNSWNHHRVPGPSGCVPIDNMLATTRTAKVNDPLIPTTPEAVKMYEDNGGFLTRNAEFGYDPLIHREDLYQSRETLFHANAPTPTEIFSEVVHCRYTKLYETLSLFHRITLDLM